MKNYEEKGYIQIYLPEHPNAKMNGLIPLHRYIMSEHLGRPLLKIEHVHHIDGNTKNNNINNLKLTTNSEHTHIHKPPRKVMKCLVCNNPTKNKKFCSNDCCAINIRKQIRPSKETLQKLLDEYPYTTVGKMFKVSDNAIRKWERWNNSH
jgi:hypothetical protein